MLFDKENREYDCERAQKDIKSGNLHAKRVVYEKENEVKCKKDEVQRKEL